MPRYRALISDECSSSNGLDATECAIYTFEALDNTQAVYRAYAEFFLNDWTYADTCSRVEVLDRKSVV